MTIKWLQPTLTKPNSTSAVNLKVCSAPFLQQLLCLSFFFFIIWGSSWTSAGTRPVQTDWCENKTRKTEKNVSSTAVCLNPVTELHLKTSAAHRHLDNQISHCGFSKFRVRGLRASWELLCGSYVGLHVLVAVQTQKVKEVSHWYRFFVGVE